jgi:galactokinase
MEKSLSFVFEEIHNSRPEVVSSVPGRINIIGEHTDYNQGYVLPEAINLQSYGPVCFIFWREKKSKSCMNSKFYY